MIPKTDKIWFDGEFVDWDEANVHVLTHSLHYGMGVFEGIRSYQTEKGGSSIFRLDGHIRRFFDSAKICNFEIPFSRDEILDASVKALEVNELEEGYIRPISFLGQGDMGVYPSDNPVRTAIIVWPWGEYLGEGALENGVRVKTSTFNRPHPNTVMTRGKITGDYVNSILAKKEAKREGYLEGILLDPEGYVSEGSGENIFLVRDGVIKTTPPSSILLGITRDTVIRIAEDLGYEVQEQKFTRDDLYIADEVFFTGTAAEITPIREIDDREIGAGEPGPVTQELQESFFDVVHGRKELDPSWLTPYDV